MFFGTGGAVGFDMLAAETIIELKNEYPYVKLIIILPCSNHYVYWNKDDVKRFEYIKSKADKIKILSSFYYTGCMKARNRHIINHSRYCIFYCRKASGGTAYTLEYAKEKNVTIISL